MAPSAPEALHEIRVAPALSLAPPEGPSIELKELRCRVDYDGQVLRRVVLLGLVEQSTWLRIAANGWFNAPASARSPCTAGEFRPEAPIELRLELAPETTTLVALLADDIWEVGVAVRFARSSPQLHRTETWRLLTATQAEALIDPSGRPVEGLIRLGLQTTWDGWQPPSPADAP